MAEKRRKKTGKSKAGSTRSKPTASKPKKSPTKPKARAGKPKKSPTKPKTRAGKPKKSPTKPKTRAGKPKKSPTKPKTRAGKPKEAATKIGMKKSKLKPKTIKGGHSKKDLKLFEQRLLEEREKVLKQLGIFGMTYTNTLKDSSGDLSSYSFHMADMGTDAMEREKAFLFASKEGRLLYHIDEALRRIYKGEMYGICQLCTRKIQKKRLDALPHARLCIDCKSKEERGV